VEKERKVIMKRSGMSSGKYSNLHVKMKAMRANMYVLLKSNPTTYSSKLQWFPTVPQFAENWFNDSCLFTMINCNEQQLNSQDSKK
jgi:hypothetical protein